MQKAGNGPTVEKKGELHFEFSGRKITMKRTATPQIEKAGN